MHNPLVWRWVMVILRVHQYITNNSTKIKRKKNTTFCNTFDSEKVLSKTYMWHDAVDENLLPLFSNPHRKYHSLYVKMIWFFNTVSSSNLNKTSYRCKDILLTLSNPDGRLRSCGLTACVYLQRKPRGNMRERRWLSKQCCQIVRAISFSPRDVVDHFLQP